MGTLDINFFIDKKINTTNKNYLLYWQDSDNIKKNISFYLEKNRDALRKEYLEIIEQINQSKVFKKKLKDSYLLNSEDDLWHMSLINEKNPYKSKSIFEIIKILALRHYIKKNNISKINLYGCNSEVYKTIYLFCKLEKIKIKNCRKKKNLIIEKDTILGTFIYANYFFIKLIIIKFKIIFKKKKRQPKNQNNIVFFSYLVHLVKNQKKFYSKLWGNLPEKLKGLENINWCHDYFPSNQISSTAEAIALIDSFNTNGKHKHFFLDENIQLRSLFLIYFYFITFYLKTKFNFNLKNFFFVKKYNLNFWYLLKNDFNRSLAGDVLIYNLYYYFLYKNLLNNKKKIKLGIFIFENQGWEYTFLKSWRKFNHGLIIGTINSTVRFWDLRYFSLNKNFKFLPDKIFLNGNYSKKQFRNFVDKKKLVISEAIRYLYLLNIKKQKKIKNSVLIFGDISENTTLEILEKIHINSDKLQNFHFFFKPHPTMNFKKIQKIRNMNTFTIINNNKFSSSSLAKYEYCICCDSTSAVIESLFLNLKTIIFRSENNLNLCPFKGLSVVSNFNDLEKFLIKKNDTKNINIKKVLFMKTNLKIWRKFIYKYYGK